MHINSGLSLVKHILHLQQVAQGDGFGIQNGGLRKGINKYWFVQFYLNMKHYLLKKFCRLTLSYKTYKTYS